MMRDDERARILAVEDLPDLQVLLRYMLKRRFDLVVVASYDEALRRAARERFDLFVLDINLGERRTGLDLLHALRRLPGCAATPAVACTAYAMNGDRERFLARGFDEHVRKPFTRQELHAGIDAVLALARAQIHAARPAMPGARPTPRAAA